MQQNIFNNKMRIAYSTLWDMHYRYMQFIICVLLQKFKLSAFPGVLLLKHTLFFYSKTLLNNVIDIK